MHLALAALRLLGALGLGLILGASAVRTKGEIPLDPVGMLVPGVPQDFAGGAAADYSDLHSHECRRGRWGSRPGLRSGGR